MVAHVCIEIVAVLRIQIFFFKTLLQNTVCELVASGLAPPPERMLQPVLIFARDSRRLQITRMIGMSIKNVFEERVMVRLRSGRFRNWIVSSTCIGRIDASTFKGTRLVFDYRRYGRNAGEFVSMYRFDVAQRHLVLTRSANPSSCRPHSIENGNK